MKFTYLALPLLLLSFNTQAASFERAEKLVNVINTEKTLVQMIAIMSDASQQGFMTRCESSGKVSKEDCQLMSLEFSEGLKELLSKIFEPKSFLKDAAEIYASEFTDEELDQLINFYTSPAGKAYIEKLPVIIQKSSALGQKRSAQLIPEIEKLIDETVEKAIKKKSS